MSGSAATTPDRVLRELAVRRLGLISYAHALELQRELVEDRKAERIPDTLLLLEHPHVITLGIKLADARTHIVASAGRLAELGVDVHETGRGGDVTYHGPGQVVGYPIVDLKPDRRDVHKYVRDLEEVMIRTCASTGVTARRFDGFSGTWVDTPRGLEKIGAIGVRISRWVTSHGFAFNVNTDLEYFKLIVPCGIADHGVTSLAALRGAPVDMRIVEQLLVEHMAAVFDRSPVRV